MRDIFDSFEESKSKTSQILFFSFHQELLEDLLNNEKSSTKKLFQLVEEYLLYLENTNLLFRDFSSKNLPKIIDKFFL